MKAWKVYIDKDSYGVQASWDDGDGGTGRVSAPTYAVALAAAARRIGCRVGEIEVVFCEPWKRSDFT